MQQRQRKVILIDAGMTTEDIIAETRELIVACDMILVDIFHQRLKNINKATYIGLGKANEFAILIHDAQIDMVIFQQTLSPLQAANLEEIFQVPVIDRSELIVEIFEQRAHTQEAKLQVRSAKLSKQATRLISANPKLGRQGGGKNRGRGEKQIELDRRMLKQQRQECERQLAQLKKQRSLQQVHRQKQELRTIALIGYTNAGKSTLLNALMSQASPSDKQVFVKDQLFATLDPALRKISLPYAPDILCADTVGFVSDLPHELIHAFHATLAQITHADCLLHIVDASSEKRQLHIQTTKDTLAAIHGDHIEQILVYNKCDRCDIPFSLHAHSPIYISATQKRGIEALRECIAQTLFGEMEAITLCIPYEESAVLVDIYRYVQVIKRENTAFGVKIYGLIRKFLKKDYVNYVKF